MVTRAHFFFAYLLWSILQSSVSSSDSILSSRDVAVDGTYGSYSFDASNTSYQDTELDNNNQTESSQTFSVPTGFTSKLADPGLSNTPFCEDPLCSQPKFPSFDCQKANIYRYRRQFSVNLGSWFVHEQWMTPSVFEQASGKQISEYDIASGCDSLADAQSLLEQHWDTFITEDDFEYIASLGINTVRLPIGYWSLGPNFCVDTPFSQFSKVYENAWSRIIQAFEWALRYGIGILLDLHGAPGSQNGQPHSGISDGQTRMFSEPDNWAKTQDILVFLAEQLCNVTNLVGIELLNEPADSDDLVRFYTETIDMIRNISSCTAILPLYIHDGFDLGRYSDFVSQRSDFVVQDSHQYFVYTPSDASEPASSHTADIKAQVHDILSNASYHEHANLYVGEWSCALTPESLGNEDDPNSSRRNFCTAQMEAFNDAVSGWSFWSYKKENCMDDRGWCFRAAVGTCLPSNFFPFCNEPLTDQLVQSVEGILSHTTHEMNFPGRDLTQNQTETMAQDISQYDCSAPGSGQGDDAKTGFCDGIATAQEFAMHDSKLGYVQQYITDLFGRSKSDIYRTSFVGGLLAGEQMVSDQCPL
ncbi:glycoside hydrolase superfamily [Desarmillaria tabescens]|uniref:Glycoside hydrolase superfamily n=1 Tax=Armillaria tabescens TaxID=1929756 RepID=A0AA39KEQ1_ARMTA|nr:glycoside hydrolase superfamily [Desarmillaria tabescens]KAK0459612.1 glycoside hydrolase superfamily [Desarmillaria tabescens]